MTQQQDVNLASGASSVNDNASKQARGEGGKKPTAKKQGKPTGYSPEIKTLTQRIKKIQGQELEARVQIGSELVKAKELLAHGKFRAWLKGEFRWCERTATSFMELARHYAGKSAKFADLDLGTALALVTNSALEKVRDQVFERAESGEKITREDVRKQIAEVKDARPKRSAKAKTDTPRIAKDGEPPLANIRSPAEEIAEALLNLLSMVEKCKPQCKPDDVAVFFVNDESKRIVLADTGAFAFVSSITEALLRMPESNFELKIAS
jgi:hypothetical protein